MGRTRRIRNRRRSSDLQSNQSLDHVESVVELKKYMSKHGWKADAVLELRSFSDTGRGLAARKKIENNDILITVPFDLMITYDCLLYLRAHLEPKPMLEIHDLLTLFLLLEKEKGAASEWVRYIDSLPQHPPHLPWLLPSDQIELFPVELCDAAKARKRLFENCWWRLRRSIRSDVANDCVLDQHKFVWAYVMVNTRAVYINPRLVRTLPEVLLSDEPSLALCPFLDMFNHSHTVNTHAGVDEHNGKLVYRLVTKTPFKKHREVFISYGPHDNPKLVMEYGFFIPGNDVIRICETEALHVLQLNPSKTQYKFLKKHGLNENMYITRSGSSFNLKAFLFVTTNVIDDYSAVVYSDSYPEQFRKESRTFIQKLLVYKLARGPVMAGIKMPLLLAYLNCRQAFIKSLIVERLLLPVNKSES